MKDFFKNYVLRISVYLVIILIIINFFESVGSYLPVFFLGTTGIVFLIAILFLIVFITRRNISTVMKIGMFSLLIVFLVFLNTLLRNKVTTIQYVYYTSSSMLGDIPQSVKDSIYNKNQQNPNSKNCKGFSETIVLKNNTIVDGNHMDMEFRCYGIYKK